MTADLLHRPTSAEAGTRPSRTGQAPVHRVPVAPHRSLARPVDARTARRSQARWAAGQSCAVAVPRVPVGDGRLYWTPRGVAALVMVVALTVAVMLGTVVTAFVAVSNEGVAAAPTAASQAAQAAAVGVLPGR